jgi:hypothetical protein
VFTQCNKLTNATIANGVTYIAPGALGSYTLKSVTIPGSVTSIGIEAFYECSGLTSVTIPGSVTNIGNSAFYHCLSLTSVYFQGNAPTVGVDAFTDETPTVYYLPGTTGWSTSFAGSPSALWLPLILNKGPSFGVQSNAFGFTIFWATNISVVVEACTNLADPVWFPVATNTLTNGSFHFSEPLQTNSSGRFYRISSP